MERFPERAEKEKNFAAGVLDESGKKIIKLTDGTNDIPLPPGKYVIRVGDRKCRLR